MLVVNQYKKKPNFLTPQRVVDSFGLSKGEAVIDYGSGAGFWAISLARKVGTKGVVYAFDSSEEKLNVLNSMAKLSGVSNIKTGQYKKEGDPVSLKQRVDFILLSNILSSIDNDEELLGSLADNAEVGTRLTIIDWNETSKLGPKKEDRIIEDEAILIAAKAGFKFKSQLEVGTFHFGLMFEYTGEKFHARKK